MTVDILYKDFFPTWHVAFGYCTYSRYWVSVIKSKSNPKILTMTSQHRSRTSIPAYVAKTSEEPLINQGHRAELRNYLVLLKALQFTISNLQVSKDGPVNWSLADRDKQIH